jgi:hypothetical protein
MAKREKANPGNPGRLLTNHYEQSAGIKSAPDTRRGAIESWKRQGAKFYCSECATMREVIAVSDIVQTPNAAIYSAILDCDHSRQIVINVHRPKPRSVDMSAEEKEKQCA